MNRQDVARIGFVLLGTWISVQMLAQLPQLAAFGGDTSFALAFGASTALGAALGVLLVVRAGALARRALPAEGPQAQEQPRASVPDVQAAALAVLGALLVAQALPRVLAISIEALRRGSDDLGLRSALTGEPLNEQILRVAAGVALFLGARPLARAWSRLRDPDLRAPGERGA